METYIQSTTALQDTNTSIKHLATFEKHHRTMSQKEEPAPWEMLSPRLNLESTQRAEFNVYRITTYSDPKSTHYIFVETESDGNGYASWCDFSSGQPEFAHKQLMGIENTIGNPDTRLIGRVDRDNYHGIEELLQKINREKTAAREKEHDKGRVWADEAADLLIELGAVKPKPAGAPKIGKRD